VIPPDRTDDEIISRILAGLQGSRTDDEIISRILAGLRANEQRKSTPTPRRIPGQMPLPHRIPGQYPASYSPWPSKPPSPTIRDARSMAANLTGYQLGWRRGQDARLVAVPITAGYATVAANRHTFLRRLAIRPGAAATRLVGIVVRALPEWERARYSEEFRAELCSLKGFRQLTFAICLTLSAPALRRALRQQAFTDTTDAE
jgi:hypothetical protein